MTDSVDFNANINKFWPKLVNRTGDSEDNKSNSTFSPYFYPAEDGSSPKSDVEDYVDEVRHLNKGLSIESATKEMDKAISYSVSKVHMQRLRDSHDLKFTRSEMRVALENLKKQGVDVNELSAGELKIALALTVLYSKGKLSNTELTDKLDSCLKDFTPAVLKDMGLTNVNELTEEKRTEFTKRLTQKFASLYSAVTAASAQCIMKSLHLPPEEGKKKAEQLLVHSVKEVPKVQKTILDSVTKAASEMPANVKKQLVESVGEFAKLALDGIVSGAKKIVELTGDFLKTLAVVAEKTLEICSSFLVEYTQKMFSEIQQKKAECKELVKRIFVAKEEVKQTEKQNNEAMETVKATTKKARAEVANAIKSSKDLSEQVFNKLLKKISPKFAQKLAAAKEAEKVAYWAEYDARSKQRLIQSELEFAAKTLAIKQTFFEAGIARVLS